MFKNTASQKVVVFAFDSTTNLPKSGDAANITAYVSKDFGAVTALTDTSATEMDATNAKGYYLFDISQTETNADVVGISAKSSTANIVVVGAPATIFTYPVGGIASPTNITAGIITTATNVTTVNGLAANVITAASIATDAIDSDAIAASAVTEIQAGLATPTNITAATGITVSALGAGVITAASIAAAAFNGKGDWNIGKTGYTLTATTGLGNQTADITGTITTASNLTTNNDKTGYSMATGGIATGDIDATALNEIADAILDRVLSAGADSGADTTAARTVRQALRALRNRVAIAAGVMTVYKENDTTASWTAAMTRTAGDPISESNPT